MRERAERIVARCRELARITDAEGETTRTFLSPAMRRVNEVVVRWMREAGMDTREDAAGNVRGVTGAGAVRLVMGSHLDTVVNAGAFDGVLGVVLAIEALAAAGKLGFGVEVIGFSEEEGVRFGVPFLGSRAAVGTLDEATLAVRDARGVSVAEAIAGCGLEVGRIREARFGAEARVYLEVHIEQGPVLEAEGRALGVVSAIAGQTRLWVRFVGHANHAGTTPMRLRKDALAAAAEWIGAVEAYAAGVHGLVATVGAIKAEPGLGNVVPGVVTASLDVRHAKDEVRLAAVAWLLERPREAGGRRGVPVTHEVVMEKDAVALDGSLTRALQGAAAKCGYEAQAMVSGGRRA